jgi:hypothetical protein
MVNACVHMINTGVQDVQPWWSRCSTLVIQMFNTGVPDVQHRCFRCSTQVFQMFNTGVPDAQHGCSRCLTLLFQMVNTCVQMINTGVQNVQPWCFRCSIQVLQISNTRVADVIHLWIKHTKQSYDTYSFSPFRNFFVSSLFLKLLPVLLRHCKSDVFEITVVLILDVQLVLKGLILCWDF